MARRRRKKQPGFELGLERDQAREITAITFAVLGVVFFLSLLGVGGRLSAGIADGFSVVFGVAGYAVALLFVVVAVGLLFPDRWPLRGASYVGFILGVLSLTGIASLVVTGAGGWLGELVLRVMEGSFGSFLSFIILFGVFLVSLLMIFHLSLADLVGRLPQPSPDAEAETAAGDPRVSVFTTVKNKLTGGSNVAPAEDPHRLSIELRKKPGARALLMRSDPNWNFPSLDLLDLSSSKPQAGNIAKNVDLIQKSLKDFGIQVSMGDVHIGPTVTQYTLKPTEGVKLTQITARQQDLALALAAHPIRIEAPIPGKAAVGIEIPNKVAAVVTLREMLESESYLTAKSPLDLVLGRDVAGHPIVVNLERMPHLLIAGATGSGKSIGINGIILTLLYRNSPSDLRLILVDPKRVEFIQYNGIPHLLAPVVTEPDKTVNVLKWCVAEMERRFRLFSEVGSRDIDSYNQKVRPTPSDSGSDEKLPYIVLVIDELADLMAQSANEVEGAIVRIAQMARATGIHLIVATQRPSVDVITGLIKANIPTRVAFAVASQTDSRTIIDQSGAEKLLGRGDMLYLGADFANKPRRIQGVLVTDKEIQSVVEFLKSQAPAQYDESILTYGERGNGVGASGPIDDDLYPEAETLVTAAGKASASLLQRRLRIGYARAARLLDLLEEQGVIGPADGSRPRDILVGHTYGDKSSFDEE